MVPGVDLDIARTTLFNAHERRPVDFDDMPPRPGTPLGFSTEDFEDMEHIPLQRAQQIHSSPARLKPVREALQTFHTSSPEDFDPGTRHSYRLSSLEDAASATEDSSTHLLTSHFGFPSQRFAEDDDESLTDDDSDSDGASCGSDGSSSESDLDMPPMHTPLPSATRRPPLVKGYSCLPSPLSLPSPSPSWSPCLTRHRYSHHGYSRRGFLQLKWFWAAREEEWVRARDAAAYGGLDVDSPLFTESIRPLRTRGTKRAREEDVEGGIDDLKPLPPLSIHPRWGDLSCLRDPSCVHMDRAFVDMPMWTLSKALWMFDLHATATQAPENEDSDDEEDSLSDSCLELLGMSALTGLSDDSDVTLVDESDSRDQTVEEVERKEEEEGEYLFLEEVDLDSSSSGSSGSSSPTPSCSSSAAPSGCATRAGSRSGRRSGLKTFAASADWYRRFDLLCRLTRFDRERMHPAMTILMGSNT